MLLFTDHIQLPSGKDRGETNVLPLLTNSHGEVVHRNNHFHALPVFVHDHLGDLGRSQGIANKTGIIGMPGDNIDFLPFEFLNHVLNPTPLHAHTGAHGIDIGVDGADGNLGTNT